MSKRKIARVNPALTAGALLFGLPGGWAQDASSTSAAYAPRPLNVRVTVNGQPVEFRGTGPQIQNDVVLVPLRGVFEKLGAQVRYDASSRRIAARKGRMIANLTVGQDVALINDKYVRVGVAPQIVGSATLVPLRLVSQALGAQVNWKRGADTIALTTDATVAEKLPVASVGTEALTGTLTGVYPEIQSITVRGRDGQNRRVPLTNGFEVRRDGYVTDLNDLYPGTQVTLSRDAAGKMTVVQVMRGVVSGTVKRFDSLPNGNTRVLLTNGTSVELVQGLPLRMSGAVVGLRDIKAGENVFVRLDPQTGLGVGLAVATASDPEPTPPEADAGNPPAAPPPGVQDAASDGTVGVKLVQPPSDPPPAESAAPPAIAEVSHDGTDRALKGGDTVALTVKGTPGAAAYVSAPALFETTNIPLAAKEGEPGTYQGTLTVPFNTQAKVTLTATLKAGDAEPVSRAFDGTLDVDSLGPEISPVAPKPNATVQEVRPAITVSYADGSKIDPKSVALTVNDKNVTADATITPTVLTFTPKTDLKAGKVAVVVSVADDRGNATQKDWTFTVKPVVPTLARVSVAPTGSLLRAGAQITVRAEGAPGSAARFKIGALAEGEMREESPGVYIGTYTVKKGDALPETAASVFVVPQSGDPVRRQTSDLVAVSAAPLAAPVIEYPTATERVRKEYLTFSGRAEPFSKVRLTVRYDGKTGFSKRGEKLFDAEAEVGEDGRWKTELFAIAVPKDVAGVVYTVSAVTVLDDTDPSPAAIVKFKK